MKFGIREIIFLGLMLGLMGSSYFFVFKPANEKRIARSAETERKRKELADLKVLMSGIGDLERKTEDLQKAINFFESKLPQHKDVDKILKEVWHMAEANQLQTKTIKTLKVEKMAAYSEQPIQMTLSGDFRTGFHAFLKQLESLDRIIRVSHMKLEKIAEDDGKVQAQLTLSIFFEPEGNGRIATAN